MDSEMFVLSKKLKNELTGCKVKDIAVVHVDKNKPETEVYDKIDIIFDCNGKEKLLRIKSGAPELESGIFYGWLNISLFPRKK